MQTEAEFPYINIYLSMCQSISGCSDTEDSMQNRDQKVPQVPFMTNQSDIMMSGFDSILVDDLSMLEPVSEMCSNTTASHDQVCVPDSPKSFTDLDTQFYPEHVHIKQEKQEPMDFPPCEQLRSQQHLNAHVQPPHHLHQQNSMLLKDDESLSRLVFGVMKQDIEHICGILRINQNPRYWSQDDVRKWLQWQSQEYCPNAIDVNAFKINGLDFCNLTQEDFKRRTPAAWSNIYHQLDIWKSACTLDTPCMSQTTDFNCNQQFYPDFERIPIPAMSPCPSVSSDDSDERSDNDEFSNICGVTSPSLPKETEHKQTIHLWQFLKELLLHTDNFSNCIKWVSQKEGIFKIEDSSRVAKLWGKRKNRPAMNYDKLSRSIRQYYKKGIIKKTTHSKRLVYQFCQPYL
ncbi:SAM pointed domain-containing Ets transcription factor-like [Mizuhopecten yessoensis]|uniref:SAM pointed domain-containing Ets transcription factor n=1 Tax=Mizuhopecten yessoensis TaxID=6573 RepID=A0A210Q763_MIZYE|nr:SAM pointed domain-containing Ets transcription factor-like [Mizuhopecten yessoensis]OWF44576.1 SAM pointed domain-containing Ets transcription factor [Mizuhopecten yessoensis]